MDRANIPDVLQAPAEEPPSAVAATTALVGSLSARLPRRGLLCGAMAGAATAALAGAGVLSAPEVHAEAKRGGATLTEIFSILATGEGLFVTFYRLGVAHHRQLGLSRIEVNALSAIMVEEQIHRNFAIAQGGVPATNNFSFPHGEETFENRALFLATQQLAEELTNGALLALIKDTAAMGLPRLAELGGQLMQVEGGHRVVGRVILGAEPWDNWAFGPIALDHFTQVPAAVTAAGFLSPRPGNDFAFKAVSSVFPGVINTHP
jgi:hypothetical protein